MLILITDGRIAGGCPSSICSKLIRSTRAHYREKVLTFKLTLGIDHPTHETFSQYHSCPKDPHTTLIGRIDRGRFKAARAMPVTGLVADSNCYDLTVGGTS